MDLYEAIYARRTVRDFREQEVSTEVIQKMIDAGLRAPTNNHLREWEFIVVREGAAKLELLRRINQDMTAADAKTIIDSWGLVDETQRQMYLDAIPKQYRMLRNAGCIIISCFRQTTPLLQPQTLFALNGFASIWCCIENILLAAANEGIYGVIRIPAATEIAHIKTVAQIPADYEIPCYLALGYPDEQAKPVVQHSVRAAERIHFNKWGN